MGTGYSRAKTIEVARRMNGVQGDIQSVGEFMRMYVARNNRQLSPLFIAGESYGTFRAAGLAGYLIDRGIAFNGIVSDRDHAQPGDHLEPQRRSGLPVANCPPMPPTPGITRRSRPICSARI